ncbi:YhgE/Pip N-terminal domain protein [Methanobacterium lacus]|uniref:YhgE/Pip N-terminal domain protein n=1 Tax=Methanobacterium lacus (strain AL-21) TaxID=877455 RepID=F0T9Q6_METLA|nr:YhgE/Pip domain-containing protein [Methanobacterium lacus]ADZ09935.1 YhgE/Pip N-terminal domain protein [Methanobacterium lacus]
MIKDVREIFKNDIKTALHSPAVMIVIFVIIIIPSLYALLNIQATWDPYSKTSNIGVAVVNEDVGYSLNGTQYNVGSMVVDELKNNTKFSWQFVDKDTAMDGVKNGKYYAALIIPSNFTENLLSIQDNSPQQAHIEYIANEKTNPVATRITNAGMDTLQAQINDQVVQTVDGIIFGKLSDVGDLVAQNKATFLKAKAFMNELNGKIGTIDSTIGQANSDMSTVQTVWPKVNAALPEVQTNSNKVRSLYDNLYNEVASDPQKAKTTITNMESQLNDALVLLKFVDDVLQSLYDVTGDQNLLPIIKQVETDINYVNNTLTILKQVAADLNNGTSPTGDLTKLKTAIDTMDDAVNLLANNRANIGNQINTAASELSVVNSKWPAIKSEIPVATAKINSISEADIDNLIAFSNKNQTAVQNYFQSPVVLDQDDMYPIANYGSALAPFYIPISLWIGSLISVAMISMRVKSRKKYNAESIYIGRMGLFLIIGFFQALLAGIGSILLGVQMTSSLLFLLTTLFIGICTMIIVYSMTSTLGNAGKSLAIVILVFQITATGGIFPLQVLPSTFQAIHPYLPVSYGVGALREIVGGVIWSTYWYNIVILGIFTLAFFVVSLIIKEKMNKRAHLMEDKLKESGLF